MLIFDNSNDAIVLDSIHTPIDTEHLWVLDLVLMDYTLAPLLVLEEIISPSIEILIAGFQFILPTNWNVLVVDNETMQLDVVEVSELAGKEFVALVYGPNTLMIETEVITVTNYHPNYINVGPSLNKHQMLCHPISPTSWINVAPSDSYNKYLKNKVAGDII
jgi:hypothetical protein